MKTLLLGYTPKYETQVVSSLAKNPYKEMLNRCHDCEHCYHICGISMFRKQYFLEKGWVNSK